jgi:hypothetical protein
VLESLDRIVVLHGLGVAGLYGLAGSIPARGVFNIFKYNIWYFSL